MSYIPGLAPNLPDPFDRLLNRAESLFESFHHFMPQPWRTTPCRRKTPEVLVCLGKLKGLIYTSDRGRFGRPRTFVHFMDTPPTLCANPEGTQLHILGGRYRVTRTGIVG